MRKGDAGDVGSYLMALIVCSLHRQWYFLFLFFLRQHTWEGKEQRGERKPHSTQKHRHHPPHPHQRTPVKPRLGLRRQARLVRWGWFPVLDSLKVPVVISVFPEDARAVVFPSSPLFWIHRYRVVAGAETPST